ncbi:myocardin-related transcription factor A isoform X2 [Ambystoma mexicanum]|uniref:myocardin-related transcription factor A isoform X2 n=1 Tax=Ambystoma mexicanum TaxID=8296 RepID=UPI0037E90735
MQHQPPSASGVGLEGGMPGETEAACLETPIEAPSPQSEAVANELQELSLQSGMTLTVTGRAPEPPLSQRKNVLQLKLQQRRTREELVSQGIMPPLKSPAAFHEQRRSLERARTEDYLKRKIRSRPQRSELVRMHILEETSAEPSLQAKQLQLKRARLADDLNEKIAQRPGPMELVEKNILPVEDSLKEAIIEGQVDYLQVADSSSFDEDSSDALSPEQPASQESQGSVPSPSEHQSKAAVPVSPAQTPGLDTHPLTTNMCPSPWTPSTIVPRLQLSVDPADTAVPTETPPQRPPHLTNGIPAAKPPPALIKQSQPKSASEKSQRSKKSKEPKPKVKKLKYHQYIPPDQKQEKGELPMDSSYAKILQQQQLFLQLQILNQQQQHYNYQTILPAPPKPPVEQQNKNGSTVAPALRTLSATPTGPGVPMRQNSSTTPVAKLGPLPSNLDDMKVAELKQELKVRGLHVSGTKIDLIERLKSNQDGNTVSKSSPARPKTGEVMVAFSTGRLGVPSTEAPLMFGSTSSSPPLSPCHSEHSFLSQDETSSSDAFGEMVSSPLTQLTLQASPAPQVKEEVLSAALSPTSFQSTQDSDARDKDQMLQEKDKQIEELTRRLWQKQQLVETLRQQLEQEKRAQQQCQTVLHSPATAQQTPNLQIKQEGDFPSCQSEEPCIFSLPKQDAPSQADQFPPAKMATLSQMDTSENTTVPNTVAVKQERSPDTDMTCHVPSVPHVFLSHPPGGISHLLKGTAPPAIITDSTGAHLVLTVTNQNADLQTQSVQAGAVHGRTGLQRVQSAPTSISSQSPAQISTSISQPTLQQQVGPVHQQDPRPILHTTVGPSGLPSTVISFSAPPKLQPFFNGLHKRSPKRSKGASHPVAGKKNSSQPGSPVLPAPQTDSPTSIFFTPPSPLRGKEPPGYEEAVKQQPKLSETPFFSALWDTQNLNSLPTTSILQLINSVNNESRTSSQQMDDLFDILIRSGEIPADFKQLSPPPCKDLPLSPPDTTACRTDSGPSNHHSGESRPPSPIGETTPTSAPGRLEDFLESTTGVPLLTGDHDGTAPLSLIDDLHSEMLSSAAILDHPPSPMDTSDLHFNHDGSGGLGLDLADTNLDSMDWLELSGVPAMSLAPLSTATPSVFSTDFLDGHDLQLHWDACL